MADWSIKQGDTAEILSLTFTLPSGAAVDLTGATVLLDVEHQASGTRYSYAMDVSAHPTTGVATWTPAAGSLPQAGLYDAEAKATLADGSIVRIPNDRYLVLQVLGNLD